MSPRIFSKNTAQTYIRYLTSGLSIMGINIEYMPFSDVQRQPQAWQDKVLGVVNFGETYPADLNPHIPAIHLNAPVLAGERIACEVWLSDSTNNSSSNQVV